MKISFHDIAGASLGAIKLLSMTGPVAIVMGGAGGLLFGMTLLNTEGHTDAILAIALMLIILAFVEMALARRFAKHEIIEKADKEALLRSMIELNKSNLETMLLQVQGVGAEYDSMMRKMKDLIRIAEDRGPRITALEEKMLLVLEGLRELEAWHLRVAGRLGTLR